MLLHHTCIPFIFLTDLPSRGTVSRGSDGVMETVPMNETPKKLVKLPNLITGKNCISLQWQKNYNGAEN